MGQDFGVRVDGLKVRIEMDGNHRLLSTEEAEELRASLLTCIYRIDGIPDIDKGSGDPTNENY